MTRRWTIPTAVPLLGWIILIAIGIKGTLPDTRGNDGFVLISLESSSLRKISTACLHAAQHYRHLVYGWQFTTTRCSILCMYIYIVLERECCESEAAQSGVFFNSEAHDLVSK